jgi:glutamine synthetase
MKQIPETFGARVFDDRVMKAMLPVKIYQSLRHTIDENATLDPAVADL